MSALPIVGRHVSPDALEPLRVADLLPPPPGPLSFTELGRRVLAGYGDAACRSGYGTTDPEWVGRYAVQYGDVEPDGTLT